MPIFSLDGIGGRVRMRRVDERRATTVMTTVAALCVAGISALTPGHAYAGDQSPPLTPDRTVSQPPTRVAAQVGATEVARVSAVQVSPEGAVAVVTQRVRGEEAATAAVADLQSDPATVSVAVADRVSVLTDDPEYVRQWAMPRLRLPEAWQASTGSGVTVAVVDTGADPTHPDLAGNLVAGADVVGSGVRTEMSDGHGHGTHVSGTVAAVTGNSVGVAGVAPDAKVMPVKVLDSSGSGYTSDVAEGVIYAADHGAQVVNLSLGGPSYNSVLAQAVDYARSRGVVVVAAAGNERQAGNPTTYPAALPGVVAVAATDSTDADASFSNTGSYVDIAAPGVSIRSTLPGARYVSWSGTSMATPHVAGVAALLRARVSSATEIEDVLLRSTTDLGPVGRDDAYGAGLVNPVAALAAVGGGSPTPPPSATPSPTPTPTSSPTTTSPAPQPPTTTPPPGPALPGAPTALRATLSGRTLTLSWTPPAGSVVSRYSARVGKLGGRAIQWRSWTVTAGTSARFAVSKGTWAVQVFATNSAGNGPTASGTTTITRSSLKAAQAARAAKARSQSLRAAPVRLVVRGR